MAFPDSRSRDTALALSLSRRLIAGAPKIRCFRAWPEGWVPEAARCHANADRWVLEHSGWSVQRGWVLNYGAPGAMANYASHSVVADRAGRLWDVTKNDSETRRFLRHRGSRQLYEQLVASQVWASVSEPMPFAVDVNCFRG